MWTGPKTERLTILLAAAHETELGDHDFCLSRLSYSGVMNLKTDNFMDTRCAVRNVVLFCIAVVIVTLTSGYVFFLCNRGPFVEISR